jgi:hypothetical protein
MAATIIKCKSVKPHTLALLETHNTLWAGSPKTEEVIIEQREKLQVTVYTNTGPLVLQANTKDATVFTDPARPDVTFRLRAIEENVA